jgi:hypothetical protein
MVAVLKCGPGNKPCGKRCVPREWECKDEKAAAEDKSKDLKPPKEGKKKPEVKPISTEQLNNSRERGLEEPSLRTKLLAVGHIASVGATLAFSAGAIAVAYSAANQDTSTATGLSSYNEGTDQFDKLYLGAVACAIAAGSFSVMGAMSEDEDKAEQEEKETDEIAKNTTEIVDRLKEFEESVAGIEDEAAVAEMYIKSDNPEKTAADLKKFITGHKVSATETYTIAPTKNGEVAVIYDGIKQKQLDGVDPELNKWMY